MTEVCSFCVHSDAVEAADEAVQEQLAASLREKPCAYVLAGRCAVADIAVERIFTQQTNEES